MAQENKSTKSGKRVREVAKVFKKYNLIKDFKAENLRKACEELGPSFVKIGQMAAMRTDLLPEEICNELGHLCVDVTPMPSEDVIFVLTEAYGKSMEDVFDDFDFKPHGSASLAQVHYAALKTGEKVAVKVQRPNARESMMEDITAMETLVERFSKIRLVKILDLKTLIRVFKQVTLEETDFLHEAQNILEYRENVENIAYSQAPQVYLDYCTQKVLVMERIDGPHIGELDALREEGYDLSDIAVKYTYNMMKQITVDGLVHFDPHTANIKIRDGKLVWLDWGMAGHFSSGERELIRRVIMALSDNEPALLTETILLLNEGEEAIDRAALYDGIKTILGKLYIQDTANLDMGYALPSVMKLLRQTHVVLPSKFFMGLRSFGIIPTIVSMLDPKADLAEILAGGIKKAVKDSSDSKEEMDIWIQQRIRNFKKISTIPVNLAEMLQNMNSNLSGFKIDMNVPEDTKSFIYTITNLILQALIIVALLISASIIVTAGVGPYALGIPLLSMIGYATALILGIAALVKKRK